jgi:hypothetical protein
MLSGGSPVAIEDDQVFRIFHLDEAVTNLPVKAVRSIGIVITRK